MQKKSEKNAWLALTNLLTTLFVNSIIIENLFFQYGQTGVCTDDSMCRCLSVYMKGEDKMNEKDTRITYCEKKTSKTEKQIAFKVSTVSIIFNTILSAGKLTAGILGRSSAMVSDAVHSASDVFSTFVVMIGVSLSSKQSDKEHPYGHERMECVASILLAVLLSLTGLGIGYNGILKIAEDNYKDLAVPGMAPLIAAIVSVAVKEAMFWYTRAAAKKTNITALMADAWHHRSDALSSVGAFAGILGARHGFPILDPVACVLICVCIEKAAFDIFNDAVSKMVDRACPEETVDQMRKVILSTQKVEGIDEIKTRLFGSKIYVDVEILMDASLTLLESHDTAEEVHLAIENSFPDVKHCTVHVNPKL